MYLDIRFSTNKNGEKIPNAVLRKSIRKNGKVTHQDFGYMSGLSLTTLQAIRNAIKAENKSAPKKTEKQSSNAESL